ncbi:MAG: penicillin-binding transpeptidase domain-containing protein [Ruminococcus sp.]
MIGFLVMAAILLQRIFSLQIIHGQEYADNFSLQTTRERTIKSTRGNILDRNGNVLAYNELSYSVTLEDSGTYDTNRIRNLSLNGEIYRLIQIIESCGDSVDSSFHIIIDENGEYAFNVTDFSLDRFRADVYGHSLIDDLEADEVNASPDQIIEDLAGEDRFGIILEEKPYTEDELESYGLPETYTKEELLKMVSLRYLLSTTSYQKYVPVTIATDISDETVAKIMENQDELEGVEVVEDSVRVYNDSEYFAPLLGYTGQISSEELETLQEENPNYSTTSIVGKTGIEQVMETTLQGTDGSETVYVDSLGKVLEIDEESRQEPVQGNDVYLTIDKDLQTAAYQILEQRIAGILVLNISPIKEFVADENTDTSAIPIPIYDVYFALVNNSVLDISHFAEEDASETEKSIYARFTQKQQQVFDAVTAELTGDNPQAYEDMSDEMQEYISYIVNDMLMEDTGILNENAIDKSDETYLAWTRDETISLQEFLTYAVSQNWIDLSRFTNEDTYMDSREVYEALAAYIADYLKTDKEFSKLLYHYLILDDVISGTELCIALYDQGILSTDDGDYEALVSGQMSSYDFMIQKISKLEITPAQLALDPCSGSVVITDPNSGEILACVSYPGYDNNQLTNQMDVSYYQKLNSDLSQPFYNKATQQRTAPGSTFKLVTSVAGLMEGVIDDESIIQCTGLFDRIPGSPLQCWYTQGHGLLNIRGGITNSCNVFMCEIAYRLGLDDTGVFSDSRAIQKLTTYAELFDFDENSGIEISEADPQISDEMPIPSAIGQGTHNYTTSQLARYVTTLANSGTSYQISLLDKITDSSGNLVEEYTPGVESQLEIPDYIWEDIHVGMRGVITETNAEAFRDLEVSLAGKTGTAQQVSNRPSHGVFIGYAPYEDPEIAMSVRIAYGYTGVNAGMVAKDILNYYFELKDNAEILTGTALSEGTSNEETD